MLLNSRGNRIRKDILKFESTNLAEIIGCHPAGG